MPVLLPSSYFSKTNICEELREVIIVQSKPQSESICRRRKNFLHMLHYNTGIPPSNLDIKIICYVTHCKLLFSYSSWGLVLSEWRNDFIFMTTCVICLLQLDIVNLFFFFFTVMLLHGWSAQEFMTLGSMRHTLCICIIWFYESGYRENLSSGTLMTNWHSEH